MFGGIVGTPDNVLVLQPLIVMVDFIVPSMTLIISSKKKLSEKLNLRREIVSRVAPIFIIAFIDIAQYVELKGVNKEVGNGNQSIV